jgi:hypothetical protein
VRSQPVNKSLNPAKIAAKNWGSSSLDSEASNPFNFTLPVGIEDNFAERSFANDSERI